MGLYRFEILIKGIFGKGIEKWWNEQESVQELDKPVQGLDTCLGEFEKWVDKSPDKAKEILVNACVLSNKEAVKDDDGLFFAAFDAITKLIPVRTATVKNCWRGILR